MNEKTTLLPTAPADFSQGAAHAAPVQMAPQPDGVPMARVIIMPGLEFDMTRKYRYGMHALSAAVLVFISFLLVEMRDCNAGPSIDLDKLQALHVSLMVFAFVLYLLSLFGIADFIFQYKLFFLVGALLVYIFAGLMIWMSYEAAVNPCVANMPFAPIDISFNKNVFTRGDTVGIIVLFLDIFATILMISAAMNFYRRY